jgi:hypothetical protein
LLELNFGWYRPVRYQFAMLDPTAQDLRYLTVTGHWGQWIVLAHDHDRRRAVTDLTLVEVIRYGLFLYGFTATISETGSGTGPVLTVTNPASPCRGTIDITDDGELQWRTRAPLLADSA